MHKSLNQKGSIHHLIDYSVVRATIADQISNQDLLKRVDKLFLLFKEKRVTKSIIETVFNLKVPINEGDRIRKRNNKKGDLESVRSDWATEIPTHLKQKGDSTTDKSNRPVVVAKPKKKRDKAKYRAKRFERVIIKTQLKDWTDLEPQIKEKFKDLNLQSNLLNFALSQKLIKIQEFENRKRELKGSGYFEKNPDLQSASLEELEKRDLPNSNPKIYPRIFEGKNSYSENEEDPLRRK